MSLEHLIYGKQTALGIHKTEAPLSKEEEIAREAEIFAQLEAAGLLKLLKGQYRHGHFSVLDGSWVRLNYIDEFVRERKIAYTTPAVDEEDAEIWWGDKQGDIDAWEEWLKEEEEQKKESSKNMLSRRSWKKETEEMRRYHDDV